MATTIERSVEIAEPPARVWAVLADLDRLGDYDPVVVKSVVIGDQHLGVGAQRRCDARQRRYFVERVTEWVEPTRLQFAIVECNLPTKNLTHAYTLEPTVLGTRVIEVMRYDTKFGLVGKLLDRLVLRSTTEKGINGFLAGLAKTVTDEATMA